MVEKLKTCSVWAIMATAILCCAISRVAAQDVNGDFDDFEEFGTQDAPPPVPDPLMVYNRFMHHVNDRVYLWVFDPLATGYGKVVPEGARLGVRRFFKNLGFPVRFVNNAAQGKFGRAGTETARFGINTTVGVLGIFDPAETRWGIEEKSEDFGQTLAHYGAKPGIPIVLPLFGPSNLRDAIGMLPDYFLDPVNHIDSVSARMAIRSTERVNYTSLHLGEYQALKRASLDPYAFFRNGYQQHREGEIQE